MQDQHATTGDRPLDDYSFGELGRIEEREQNGETLTDHEHRVLDHARHSPAGKAGAALLRQLNDPAHQRALAAYEALPPRLRRRYDHRTFKSTRGDAFFRMYERRMSAPTRDARLRPAAASTPRPRARRASSSSRTSGVDPGDDDPHHPERALGTLHDRTLVAAGVTR